MNQWHIGKVKVTRVIEMEVTGGSRFILPEATREAVKPIEWLQPHFADAEGNLIMSIHALVVETQDMTMIVDTCIGNDKQRSIPSWTNLQLPFLQDLADAGYDRETIDTVMCTHLHVDHVGWNTMRVDDQWLPTFPNARYLMGKTEFEYWDAIDDDAMNAGVMDDSVRPVFDAGLVDLVDTDHRISDEIYLESTPGHTPVVHLIGPGMGHAYHPQTLADLLNRMQTARDCGLDLSPQTVSLQTQTLRYSKMFWVKAMGLERHWRDSRVDAEKSDSGEIVVATKNITSLALSPRPNMAGTNIRIDRQAVKIPAGDKLPRAVLAKRNGQWKLVEKHSVAGLAKVPGLQGPIDDCFLEPFLVVRPTGKFANKKVAGWVEFELAHFEKRWRELFRGEVRIKNDRDVTAEDIERYHLVLWGDPSSNSLLAKCAGKLPIRWSAKEVQVGEHSFSAADHVPLAIYPNPLASHKYVVLNSGPTFRERHDRTNSLQNPKLPDWAILNLSQPPDGERAGKVVAADFFDERWQVQDLKRD